MRTRTRRSKLHGKPYQGSHKDTAAPAELELLHTRALLAVKNFTHYEGDDYAVSCMEKLFKDYKKHKDRVKKALINAFVYLKEENPPKAEKVVFAKQQINEIAKRIWK